MAYTRMPLLVKERGTIEGYVNEDILKNTNNCIIKFIRSLTKYENLTRDL